MMIQIKTWFSCKPRCTKRWAVSSPKQRPSKHGLVQFIQLQLSQQKNQNKKNKKNKKKKDE